MISRRRKPARKNTRRARGRRTNRERPTAPYRTGDTGAMRVIPPPGEAAQAHPYATTREARHQRQFRFRDTATAVPAPAEPGNGLARMPGTPPTTAERDTS